MNTYARYLLTFLALAAPALAQTSPETVGEGLGETPSNATFPGDAQPDRKIPSVVDEEDEDLGPQYLLVPGTAAHQWFQAVADFQLLRSSNPTLDSASVREASDLAVATAQFLVQSPDKSILGGDANALVGLRHQVFRYSNLDDTEINGLPVDRSDFEGTTFFSNLSWEKDNWQAGLGLRWTQLDSASQGSGFFEEVVPSWELSRDFYTSPNTRIRLKYAGAYHATESDAFLPQFDDLNDRLSNTFSVSWLQRLNQKFYLEPSARITYADYQGETSDSREDTTIRLGAALSYFPSEAIQIRFFTGYQKRNSDGVGIVDYENWDLGIGTTFSARF